jgi:hypothetical protein
VGLAEGPDLGQGFGRFGGSYRGFRSPGPLAIVITGSRLKSPQIAERFRLANSEMDYILPFVPFPLESKNFLFFFA